MTWCWSYQFRLSSKFSPTRVFDSVTELCFIKKESGSSSLIRHTNLGVVSNDDALRVLHRKLPRNLVFYYLIKAMFPATEFLAQGRRRPCYKSGCNGFGLVWQ